MTIRNFIFLFLLSLIIPQTLLATEDFKYDPDSKIATFIHHGTKWTILVADKLPDPIKSGQQIARHDFLDYTTTCPTPATEACIEAAGKGTQVAIVDCDYGLAAVRMLQNGASVYALFGSEVHLKVLEEHIPEEAEDRCIYGQCAMTDPVWGLSPNFFDSVLMQNVFVNKSGEEIEGALEKASLILKPGGVLYIDAYSIFAGRMQRSPKVLAEWEKRKGDKDLWPSDMIVADMVEKGQMPQFAAKFHDAHIHLLEIETLEAALKRVGFKVTKSQYYPRPDFSEEASFADADHGRREGLMILATKPE